jgi:hypothetical protein
MLLEDFTVDTVKEEFDCLECFSPSPHIWQGLREHFTFVQAEKESWQAK